MHRLSMAILIPNAPFTVPLAVNLEVYCVLSFERNNKNTTTKSKKKEDLHTHERCTPRCNTNNQHFTHILCCESLCLLCQKCPPQVQRFFKQMQIHAINVATHASSQENVLLLHNHMHIFHSKHENHRQNPKQHQTHNAQIHQLTPPN